MVNVPPESPLLADADILRLQDVIFDDVHEFINQYRAGMNVRLLVPGGMRYAERNLECLDHHGIRGCKTAKIGSSWEIIPPEKK